MSKSNERNPHVTVIHIGSRVSTTTAVLPGIYFRKKSKILRAWFVDQAGIASASAKQVVDLRTLADVVYATVDTSATAAVANVPLAMTITSDSNSTNSPEKTVPAGTNLCAKIVGTSTAVLTDACIMVEWYPL